MSKDQLTLSLFPLPEVVLFPGINLPLHIYEERYKKMISNCLDRDKQFGVVFAKNNICAEIGTIAQIIDVEKLEEGKMNILTEGRHRFKILNLASEEPYYEAVVQLYEDKELKISNALKNSLKKVKEMSLKALSLFDEVFDQELSKKLKLPKEPNELLFLVSANLTCSYEAKQSILETNTMKERIEKVFPLLEEEIERLEVLLENKETRKDVVKNGKLKI